MLSFFEWLKNKILIKFNNEGVGMEGNQRETEIAKCRTLTFKRPKIPTYGPDIYTDLKWTFKVEIYSTFKFEHIESNII